MKRLIFSPSLRNLIRQSWFERSLLLSWVVAMSAYLVQVVVLSVARLAGTVAKKTRRTRTSDYVVGFMQQRPSKLLDMCQQRGMGMADNLLFIEHSHLIEKGVSAFFIICIRASCSFLQISPSFFSQKIINIADCRSVLVIVCNNYYTFVVRIWHIQLRTVP